MKPGVLALVALLHGLLLALAWQRHAMPSREPLRQGVALRLLQAEKPAPPLLRPRPEPAVADRSPPPRPPHPEPLPLPTWADAVAPPALAAAAAPTIALTAPAPVAAAPRASPIAQAVQAATAAAAEEPVLLPPEHRLCSERQTARHYPALLRERGIEGRVLLRVKVDELGQAAEVLVLGGSGWRLLDEAAREVARACPYLPARRGEQRLASWVEIPVRFALQRTPSSAMNSPTLH